MVNADDQGMPSDQDQQVEKFRKLVERLGSEDLTISDPNHLSTHLQSLLDEAGCDSHQYDVEPIVKLIGKLQSSNDTNDTLSFTLKSQGHFLEHLDVPAEADGSKGEDE